MAPRGGRILPTYAHVVHRQAALPWLVAAGVLLASCTAADEPTGPAPPQPLTATWSEVTLPVPPGPTGRVAVRDAVHCGDRWYVVGGIFIDADNSRPAAWSSADGTTWTSEVLEPRGYWSRRSVLSSVACHDDQVAMIGAKSGGAHGNPRVATWHVRDDGSFVDVVAGYTLFGGAQATNVGGLAGGPDGWLIVGNRTSGAAVWGSADATEFTLTDDDPQLSSDDRLTTFAIDQVPDGAGWVVVGSASVEGRLARVPQAWTSPDGQTWERETVPSSEEFNDLERVVQHRAGLLALGLRGEKFGAWRRDESGVWELAEEFGELDPDRSASPSVSGLTLAGSDVLATVSDGTRYQLWAAPGDEPWRPVETPTRPETGGEQVMTVASDGTTVLLLTDDAESGKVWRSDWTGEGEG